MSVESLAALCEEWEAQKDEDPSWVLNEHDKFVERLFAQAEAAERERDVMQEAIRDHEKS
jgi:hypothetical protein